MVIASDNTATKAENPSSATNPLPTVIITRLLYVIAPKAMLSDPIIVAHRTVSRPALANTPVTFATLLPPRAYAPYAPLASSPHLMMAFKRRIFNLTFPRINWNSLYRTERDEHGSQRIADPTKHHLLQASPIDILVKSQSNPQKAPTTD